MIKILGALEPRLYDAGETIIEAGEEVDEQIFVINRDHKRPSKSTGFYCIGFSYKQIRKYYHVKLGPKSIICGYENLYNKSAEFSYRAMMNIDAYGLRKSKLYPILKYEPEIRTQMCRYTLEFYHTIVRRPMLEFKKKILVQVSKSQDEEKIMRKMDKEIIKKEEEYIIESEIEFGTAVTEAQKKSLQKRKEQNEIVQKTMKIFEKIGDVH